MTDDPYTVILRSPQKLNTKEAARKSRQLAELQEEIISLVGVPSQPSQKLTIDDVYIRTIKKRLTLSLDMPLFYEKEMFVHLDFFGKEKNILAEEMGVITRFKLDFWYFSDLESLQDFEQLLSNTTKNYFIEVAYYFDTEGHVGKVVYLPEEIQTDRAPLAKDVPLYRSIMTQEDFVYAERALLVLRHRLQDYLQVKNKTRVFQ